MRTALVGPTHPYKGGIAQHTTELAHRLAATGERARIVSWSRQYPTRLYPGRLRVDTPELPPFPATCYPLAWNRPDGWLRTGRALRRCADGVVVVLATPVQVPAYRGLLAGARLGRPAGPRTLALCHNVLPHEPRRFDRRLVRSALRRVDAVLVHSPDQRDLAVELTTRPVVVAALPPHLPGPALPATTPAGDGADRPARRRLLFFGLVRPYKGLDLLLRAMVAGPAEVTLVVAGEFWGGTGATEALVDSLGLRQRVELRPGYVDAADLPELFAGVDALVLPYRSGTASQNVHLGHRYGLPVVATRTGSAAVEVRDGVDGLLCPADDVAALSAALHRLYRPGELARLRRGVRPVDADARWSAYLGTLLRALYR